jgi:hypothetical protein
MVYKSKYIHPLFLVFANDMSRIRFGAWDGRIPFRSSQLDIFITCRLGIPTRRRVQMNEEKYKGVHDE